MNLLEATPDPLERSSMQYIVECHACATPFDALSSDWCSCIIKERSVVCPSCERCFCRADVEYKRTFWTGAPAPLWDRKQQNARQQSTLLPNPGPDEVRRPLVLVIDDDRDIRAVAVYLVGGLGFGCIHAADGSEGLELARQYMPDVILTDALMPKMDGRELCRLVKTDGELAQTKVIIMSSVYTAGRFKREAMSQFKADGYVAKPIDAELLSDLLGGRAVPQAESAIPEPAIEAEEVVSSWVPASDGVATEEATPLLSVLSNDFEMAIVAPPPIDAPEDVPLPAAGEHDVEVCAAPPVRGAAGNAARLIALHSAGVPTAFVRELDARLFDVIAAADLILLWSAGCEAAAVNGLSAFGYGTRDIIALTAADVPLSFVQTAVRDDRRLSASEMIRLYCANIDAEYLRALRANGFADAGADDWIRLWSAGVTAQFVETAVRVLPERSSAKELVRLWLTGIDAPLLEQMTN